MQYYSTYNGYPNSEANFPYIPISAAPVLPRSQVVGEGDVTSVTLPDGTLQLYFVPVSRATTCNGNYQQWGVIPAWFIRTIPNLFSAPLQPFSSNYRDITQVNNSFQNNVVTEEVPPKYQLQLHSDKLTSSTDLHYFCQQAQPYSRHPRQSVQTQADQPLKTCEACCKSCRCGQVELSLDSDMSIDGTVEEKPPCCCYRNFRSTHKVQFSSESLNRMIREA